MTERVNPGVHVATWILSVLLAVIFLLAGAAKVVSTATATDMFARWGYAPWFMYLIGAIEVVGAVMLTIPKSAYGAALVLATVMIGAIVTHLAFGELGFAIAPLVMVTLLGFIAYVRRPEAEATGSRSAPGRDHRRRPASRVV